MSSEFGSELTKLGLPAATDAATLAAEALKRNRRRIRSLASLTIGLWILTFLLVPGMWMPFAAKMTREAQSLAETRHSPLQSEQTDARRYAELETMNQVLQDSLMYISKVSGAILAVITLASLLAAISTVWLVLTVRRVTLEQLAAGLAHISEQLRQKTSAPEA